MSNRIIDPTQGVDPNLKAAVAGRGKVGTREPIRKESHKRKDKFYVPPHLIPKGMCVEWKRKSYFGKPEDVDYAMDLAESGWKNAPIEAFKTLMPEEYTGKTVERGGMILMMRPLAMKQEAQRLDKVEADNQVRDKLTEIGMTGQGELKRQVHNFSREYGEPVSSAQDGETEE